MRKQVEIIVVSSVEDFRRLAGSKVGEEDAVLEIGCSTGKTTRKLAKTCARVVAVDVSSEMVDQTREEVAGFDNVEVVCGDARDIVALKPLMPEPDAIFLDIGGRALLDNVATLLRQCLRAFGPRLIVVRSHELAEVASLITEARPPARLRLRQLNPSAREEALRAFLELSHSSSVSSRLLAVQKLAKNSSAPAQQRLSEMAEDPNTRVRRAANVALKKREAQPGGA
jgi:precorrin-6B methylase 2